MKILNLKGIFIALFSFSITLFADSFVVNSDKILSQKVEQKIQSIANELYTKSGIYAGVGVYNKTEFGLKDSFDRLGLKPPYAFLILDVTNKKVEIFADEQTLTLFDKEKTLSPYPEKGTILPILASNKGKDIYNAAMLNGYADIAEQIAKSKGITLENSIGNANKDTMNILRLFVYASFIFVLVVIFYRKRVKNER